MVVNLKLEVAITSNLEYRYINKILDFFRYRYIMIVVACKYRIYA